MAKNAIYAQSGGVTSVINSSAYGVIKQCFASNEIDKVYCGINGINGVLNGKLADMSQEELCELELLPGTPSSAFGSCRRKLNETDEEEFKKLFEVFDRYNVGYFFYNGGNDSMDTANKIHKYAIKTGYDIKVMGVPKTIDNDLIGIDHCPGYGSAAKYMATSILEGSLDVRSMSADSTKVFIMEAMGRHAGWLAASGALARGNGNFGPHIILVPESAFDKEKFFEKVQRTVEKEGYCSIIVSEGAKYADGKHLADSGETDHFGNVQLGGAGLALAGMLKNELKMKCHVAMPDYLQRSGAHVASLTDIQEAVNVGRLAVKYALEGNSGYMVTMFRKSSEPYIIDYGMFPLSEIANNTKYLAEEFISEDGMDITEDFIRYALPLIKGEFHPLIMNGVPKYAQFKLVL